MLKCLARYPSGPRERSAKPLDSAGKGCKSLIMLSGSTGFTCSFERCSSDFGSKWLFDAFFVERLPSNKEGKNSKCFAERRFLSRNLAPGCTVVIPNSLGCLRHEEFWASRLVYLRCTHPSDARALICQHPTTPFEIDSQIHRLFVHRVYKTIRLARTMNSDNRLLRGPLFVDLSEKTTYHLVQQRFPRGANSFGEYRRELP